MTAYGPSASAAELLQSLPRCNYLIRCARSCILPGQFVAIVGEHLSAFARQVHFCAIPGRFAVAGSMAPFQYSISSPIALKRMGAGCLFHLSNASHLRPSHWVDDDVHIIETSTPGRGTLGGLHSVGDAPQYREVWSAHPMAFAPNSGGSLSLHLLESAD